MLDVSPPDLVAIAGRCGYRYVGLRLTEVTGGDAWPLIEDRSLLQATRQEMDSSGVGVLDVELVRVAPRFASATLSRCSRPPPLGAASVLTQGMIGLGTPGRQFRRFLRPRRALRRDRRCRVPDLDRNARTLAEARALVETAGRENAGLMIDTLHFSRSRCRLEEIDDIEEEADSTTSRSPTRRADSAEPGRPDPYGA